jgi:protocatechuate 3,4-dioxygenase beta subunit
LAPGLGEAAFGGHDADLIHNFNDESAIGPRIVVYGLVHDEFGRGTGGALVEVWPANAGWRYRHNKEGYVTAFDSNFGGCGRVISDADRKYEFRT